MSCYLQYLMDRIGLSASVLARWLGINKGKMSRILRGQAWPNKSEKRKLEQTFKNLPIEILLERIEDDQRKREVAGL